MTVCAVAAPAGSSRWLYYIDEAFSVSRFRDGRRTTASLSLQSADGKLGLATRQAVKAAQVALGVPADSYPSIELIERLRASR